MITLKEIKRQPLPSHNAGFFLGYERALNHVIDKIIELELKGENNIAKLKEEIKGTSQNGGK